MEKLIQLLNEYMPNMIREERHNGTEIFTNIHNSDLFICYTERVISKRFGFIKWLVDNDKIDRTYRKDLKYPYYIDDKERDLKGYGKSNLLIMLCSIQDNPIEFLISILK